MIFWGMLKAAGHDFSLVRTRGDQRLPKANPVNRYLYSRLADAVIATNSRTARQCKDMLGVKDSSLHMIPGGVDRSVFAHTPAGRMKIRKALGWRRDDLAVGLIGRFDPVKGQKELLDAFSMVRQRRGLYGGELRLMLLGYPAAYSLDDVKSWLRERNLTECSVVFARVEDIASHISAMDLGVVASRGSEAIARAALEIMSCGVALIGTDVGVMPDLLSADALVPPGDTPALAALLERALMDAEFRNRLQREQAARMPGFSQESFLKQTLAVYQSLRMKRM